MATSSSQTDCVVCNRTTMIYVCPACAKHFCFNHLTEHRADIAQQYDELHNIHNQLRQKINDFKIDPTKHPLIKQIDRWEMDSIDKVRQVAIQCKNRFIRYSNAFLPSMEKKLNHLAEQMKDIHRDKELNEIAVNDLKQRLETLQKELNQPTNISIQQQATSIITRISLVISSDKDARWKQFATTIAGGNGQGDRLDQLNCPGTVCIEDQNQMIYISQMDDHRIVEWKLDTNSGRTVVGEKHQGSGLGPLNRPTDVIIDRQNNDLIIADLGNKRIMKWSRHSNLPPQITTDDITCFGLAMHDDGTLYVSDFLKHKVRRWKRGETQGTLVAGGNGEGNQLNQLDFPTFLFVDDDHTLYISDSGNHRVMKWRKDAKEGVIVAGGNGAGNRLSQLSHPGSVKVDQYGQVYVADSENHRVMQWCEGAKKGRIVIGGNGKGQGRNQLNFPAGLSFDDEGNLYVADFENHRIQKFERDFD